MPLPVVRHIQDLREMTASDGAKLFELFTKDRPGIEGIGLAVGELDPGRTANPHRHDVSQEIYFVASGFGRVHMGGDIRAIGPLDAVYIPTGCVHALENISASKKLVVLCISCPPYQEDDFHLVSV